MTTVSFFSNHTVPVGAEPEGHLSADAGTPHLLNTYKAAGDLERRGRMSSLRSLFWCETLWGEGGLICTGSPRVFGEGRTGH